MFVPADSVELEDVVSFSGDMQFRIFIHESCQIIHEFLGKSVLKSKGELKIDGDEEDVD